MKWINVKAIGKDTPYGNADPQFKAMYIIRQFRMGIVSVKQIQKLTDYINNNQPHGLTEDAVKQIIGGKQ